MKATIWWPAAELLRARELVELGDPGPELRSLPVDLSRLSRDERARWAAVFSLTQELTIGSDGHFLTGKVQPGSPLAGWLRPPMISEVLDRAEGWVDAAAQEKARQTERQRAHVQEIQDLLSENEELLEGSGIRVSVDSITMARAKALVKEAKEKRERETFRKELESWVRKHGSSRIKVGAEKGYDMLRAYAEERAALEAPGWFLDYKGESRSVTRASPSANALDLLLEAEGLVRKGIGASAQIVWMTESPGDFLMEFARHRDGDGCEVIVILDYLGRFALIRASSSRVGVVLG